MREDEIYLATKIWFQENGFVVLAGQPPNGCDNIPTIEIKDISNKAKGSKGAFKPDLVFASFNYLILVECKPRDDVDDENKLLEVNDNISRQKLLFEEIKQRGIFKRRNLEPYFPDFNVTRKKLRYCLSHNGQARVMQNIMTLSIKSIKGEGVITNAIDNKFQISF